MHYFGNSDQANVTGNYLDDIGVFYSIGGGTFWGNRNAIHGRIQISPSPAMSSGGNHDALFGNPIVTSGSYGSGQGGLNDPGVFSQSTWGIDTLPVLSGARNFTSVWGAEFGIFLDSTSTVGTLTGAQVTRNAGTFGTGIFSDQGYALVDQDDAGVKWKGCGYCVGSSVTSWPIDPNVGTIFAVQPRLLSGVETQGALFGFDFRPLVIASGGEAVAMPNMAVDGAGGTHASTLYTASSIQNETATLTGVSILADGDGIAGGLYTSIPTLTVPAPPSGITATATVATMTLGKIVGLGSTGSAYTINDILTVPGGTGTAPTLKAAAVDGSGAITSCTIQSGGALTSLPTTSIIYPTGGTGIGAGFFITYANGVPVKCTPAVTGKNYVIGDVVGTGGTGTPGALTVDTVDAFGGILTAHPTTAGSLTALPTSPVTVTGGSGTIAKPILGFSIAAVTLTPGSGYVNEPLWITAQQSLYRTARINGRMTAVEGALSINPGGHPVTFGGTIGFGTFTNTTCSNVGFITITDSGGTTRKLMVCS
jgi:hypothetical protein